jgi:peptidoglycan/LPS O-acetylase OafA/YrhL
VAAARISELDGIRGYAVGLILIQHFWPNVGYWRVALPLTEMGWIGVDLFFVLSGFLITGILLDSLQRPAYFQRFYNTTGLPNLPSLLRFPCPDVWLFAVVPQRARTVEASNGLGFARVVFYLSCKLYFNQEGFLSPVWAIRAALVLADRGAILFSISCTR